MSDRIRAASNLKTAATLGKLERIDFWQTLGSQAIFEAADELIRRHCEENQVDPSLDKTIMHFQRDPLPKEK